MSGLLKPRMNVLPPAQQKLGPSSGRPRASDLRFMGAPPSHCAWPIDRLDCVASTHGHATPQERINQP